MGRGRDHLFEHLFVHFLNLIFELQVALIRKPGQHFLLVADVAFVNQRIAIAEEGQAGERGDAKAFGQIRLFRGDQMDPVFVRFVVNFLQLVQDRVAALALLTRPTCAQRSKFTANLKRKATEKNCSTEINDDVFVGFDDVIQQLVRQLLDRVAVFLLHQPGQDRFFLAQIA